VPYIHTRCHEVRTLKLNLLQRKRDAGSNKDKTVLVNEMDRIIHTYPYRFALKLASSINQSSFIGRSLVSC
jgi:hypothetical protein